MVNQTGWRGCCCCRFMQWWASSPISCSRNGACASDTMRAAMLAISVGVADVRRNPDASSEMVTQALMDAQVVPGPTEAGWQWVRLADYEGWVRAEHVAAAPAPSASGQVAVVTALSTALLKSATGTAVSDGTKLYLSTVL